MGDGLGDVRVERLVLQVEGLETLLAQLAEHDVEQRPDLVGMPQVGGLGGVEHGQHRLGEPRRGPVGLVADLLLDPLAVVLEVGLHPLGDVLVLVALLAELADLRGDLGGQLVLRLRPRSSTPPRRRPRRPSSEGVVGVLLGRRLALLGDRGHDFASPSSSTISASTISSSSTGAGAVAVCPDADVPAALASRDAAS